MTQRNKGIMSTKGTYVIFIAALFLMAPNWKDPKCPIT